MRPVFLEIQELATAKLREALAEYSEEASLETWDPDAFEQEVRQFSQQLGQQMLQVWAEEQTQSRWNRDKLRPASAPVGKDARYTSASLSGG